MFWIGLIVGVIIGIGAVAAWLFYCYKVTFRDVDTFVDMVNVLAVANENRESHVIVTHNDEVLATAVFEEIE